MALKELSNEPKFVQIGSAISEKHEQDRLCLEKVHIHTHTHIHTYIHTQTFFDLVDLSRMVYNTRGLRGSDQKLVFPVILYPFYRERQKCWQTELQRESISPYTSPVWIVPKKSNAFGRRKFRLVIDYRKLNEKTK